MTPVMAGEKRETMRGTDERMERTGGGYALAGFVYQLLGSLDFATSVAVAPFRNPQGPNDTVTVTIEPPSGGDATHAAGADKATIQFKTHGRGNFTERDVLVEVFPDLFKAARSDAEQAFVLRTDAPVKLTPAFERLAELLRSHPLETALDQAEAEGLRFKAHQAKGTRSAREHFDWLLGVVSPKSRTEHDRQSLAVLIGRFRVEDKIDEKSVFDRVMKGLRQLAGTHEDAEQLFKTLIGHLVILATSAFRTVTVESIFADCHVDKAKLVSTVQFVARLHEDFAKAMRDLGYAPSQDSRAKALAALGPRPCALAGPSGVGKTWAMARAATEAEQSGAVVIWVDRPPNERDRLQAHIAQRVQRARDRTAQANPLAMRSILNMASGSGPALRVCVCLDRFSSPTIAHDLITDPWWADNGIEVIAALPAAEPDAVVFEPGVTLVAVDGFTLGEVRRFLKQRRVDWVTIPVDILRLLRIPGLARQFAALGTPTFRPSDEYVLMEAAWRREPPGHVQPLRAAKAVLEARLDVMVEALLKGQPVLYPWPQQTSPVLLETQVELLERFGFIRWSGDGGIQLDTDRTLSWTLAEALARKVSTGAIAPDMLEPLMQRWWQGDDTVPGLARHALGYVPLDLLWLLAADGVTPMLMDLVRAITPGRRMLDWDDIATLGSRGAAIARAFVVSTPPKDWPPFRKPLVDALLAGGLTQEVRRLASHYLRSRTRDKRMLALDIYTRHPDPRQLPTLVKLRAGFDAKALTAGPDFVRDYQEQSASYDAAAAAARLRPGALLKLAAASPPAVQVRTLAWLISELPPAEALVGWRKALPIFEALAPDVLGRTSNQHLLVLADPGVVKRLSPEQADDVFLFEAQCVIYPEAALARLAVATPEQWSAWIRYIDAVFRCRPADTEALLLNKLADGSLDSRDLARGMATWGTLASSALWAALIARTPTEDPKALSFLWRTIESTATTALLGAVQVLSGSALERALSRRAQRRAADYSGRSGDPELETASRVLLRLDGKALAQLTRVRLSVTSDIERREGERDALLCNGATVARALSADLEHQFDGGKGRVSQSALEALGFVAPKRAATLVNAWLKGGKPLGIWAAGEAALDLNDPALAKAVLGRLGKTRASANRRLETRLLGWFRCDDARLRKVVAKALKEDGSEGRALVLWVAERMGDEALFLRVEQALNQDLARSDYRDSATIATLSHHEVIGPRLLARLRTTRSGLALQRILADIQIAPTWASDDLFAEMALDDALQFRSSLINTPRDGQNRLWRTDPDLAFEVFEQGLSQGGKASEGLAGPAVQTAADRAAPILLKFITLPGNEKVAADIGRALRIAPDPALVETQIRALLASEIEEVRIRGLTAAGWMATPGLDAAILEVRKEDARTAVRRAVRDATSRSDRLGAMMSLAVAAGQAAGETRWRLLALLAGQDEDRVLRGHRDPLRRAIGDLDDRDAAILEARLKR